MSKRSEKVLRAQQIRIKKGHRLYNYLDEMSFKAKNLYNIGNFYIRQTFTGLRKEPSSREVNEQVVIETVNTIIPQINELKTDYVEKRRLKELTKPQDERAELKEATYFNELTSESPYLSYNLLDAVFKTTNQSDYLSLPAHTNQHILQQLFADWKSFYKARADYKINPSKYLGRPKIPKYAPKTGRKSFVFTNQTCTIKDNKYLKFPHTKTKLNIGKLGLIERLKEVRVIPKTGYYVLELILEQKENPPPKTDSPTRITGIDIGVNNLATIVNNIGSSPVIIKGKALKSINQYYNKLKARYYSILRQGKSQKEGDHHSQRLNRLDQKRGAKAKDFLHKASYNIIKYCAENNIDTIVIGKNPLWKQKVKLRKNNTQNFTSIPFSTFIDQIIYKAEEKGIRVIVTEESYTSRASFLDGDNIPVFDENFEGNHQFSGSRIKRGLYRTGDGTLINADVNAAANMIIKAVPNAFSRRDRGAVSVPQTLQKN